jgi:hypothetical protein
VQEGTTRDPPGTKILIHVPESARLCHVVLPLGVVMPCVHRLDGGPHDSTRKGRRRPYGSWDRLQNFIAPQVRPEPGSRLSEQCVDIEFWSHDPIISYYEKTDRCNSVPSRGPDSAEVLVIDVLDDALQPLAIRCGRRGTPQDGDVCAYPRLRSGGHATTRVVAAVVDDSFDVAGNSACAQAVGATDPHSANDCAGVTIPVATGPR